MTPGDEPVAEPGSERAAREACERLAATHPDRATHRWLPRHTDAGWEVVKVGLPPPLDHLQAEQRADERPATGEDPRTSIDRNVGGPWIGG